jgi:hypothetical protein
MARFEMTWEAPEFEYVDKDVSWYWISMIVAALIVAFAVWTKNFLFGLFIVIAEVLLISFGNKEPRIIPFKLSDQGLAIGEAKNHLMREFQSWSAGDYEGALIEIYFMFKAKMKIPLMVLVPKEKLDALRENLKTVLTEVEHKPSLLDSIEKITRF